MTRKLAVLCTFAFLGLLLGACEDDRINPLWIESFGVEKKEIPVGQSIPVKVKISEPAPSRLYVEIKNDDYKDVLELQYGTAKNKAIIIKYEAGQSSHDIKLVGLKAGTGKVLFQIRSNATSYQGLEFVVKDLVNIDAGPTLDYGAVPDLPIIDSGAATKEASTADKGAAKEASAPDAGTKG